MNKKEKQMIPDEKMALLAEKGLKNARLTQVEIQTLAHYGMDEYVAIKEGLSTPNPAPDKQAVKKMMAAYHASVKKERVDHPVNDIIVQLRDAVLKILRHPQEWLPVSPVFAQRGETSGSVSFSRETAKGSAHIEINHEGEQRFSLTVKLTDSAGREQESFEAALYRNDRCIETLHVARNTVASFHGLVPDAYSLKVSNKKGELFSVPVRLEE